MNKQKTQNPQKLAHMKDSTVFEYKLIWLVFYI